ncbi:hypothetical protein DRB89_26675 [Streptomyces sp. ICC4]|nr:hypothetical protein DRB89_26675 [Streptomyces sp. ICC4]
MPIRPRRACSAGALVGGLVGGLVGAGVGGRGRAGTAAGAWAGAWGGAWTCDWAWVWVRCCVGIPAWLRPRARAGHRASAGVWTWVCDMVLLGLSVYDVRACSAGFREPEPWRCRRGGGRCAAGG